MRRRAKGRIPRFLISLLLLSSLWTSIREILGELSRSPFLRIKEVRVSGNRAVRGDEILRRAGISKGDGIFDVSLERAYKGIMGISRIKRASLKRPIPTRVEIRVEERSPVALVRWGDGRIYEVDEDGVLMELLTVPRAHVPDLPIIRGSISSGGMASSIKEGVRAIKEMYDVSPSFASRISELEITDRGLLSLNMDFGNCKVLIRPGDIRRSVLRAEKLLEGIEDIELLDLTEEGRAIIKRRIRK